MDKIILAKLRFVFLCLFLAGALFLSFGINVEAKRADTQSDAKKTKSKPKAEYLVKVNKQANCVTIYKKNGKGKYIPVKAMACSSGYATKLGTFYTMEKYRWHKMIGNCYAQYCNRIYGGVLFHSVWYYRNYDPSSQSIREYNKLGTTASHGCIRLSTADAKYIYDYIPSGTKVIIYNSPNPGPLGKPVPLKVSGGMMGWDPTDMWSVGNPYLKSTPKIKVTGDFYVSSKKKLTKNLALKYVRVTQSGKALAGKYIKVSYKKKRKNVYEVIYLAQKNSLEAKGRATAYVDNIAPQIVGVKNNAVYRVPVTRTVNKVYAKSRIKRVYDNYTKCKKSDVKITLKKVKKSNVPSAALNKILKPYNAAATASGSASAAPYKTACYRVVYKLRDKVGNTRTITVYFVQVKTLK